MAKPSIEKTGDVTLVNGKVRVEETINGGVWKVYLQDEDEIWQEDSSYESETDAMVAATALSAG